MRFALITLIFFISVRCAAQSDIWIEQGNRKIIIKKSTSVQLKKAPFTIGFSLKEYHLNSKNAIRIAAFSEEPNKIKSGTPVKSLAYFAPGTGWAGYPDAEYSSLIIDDIGHHYIFYSDEKERRAHLVERNGEWLDLTWTISRISYKDKNELPIDQSNIQSLYLMLISDKNLDGKLDKKEWKIVRVIFE
jgi:hypothetical protein